MSNLVDSSAWTNSREDGQQGRIQCPNKKLFSNNNVEVSNQTRAPIAAMLPRIVQEEMDHASLQLSVFSYSAAISALAVEYLNLF